MDAHRPSETSWQNTRASLSNMGVIKGGLHRDGPGLSDRTVHGSTERTTTKSLSKSGHICFNSTLTASKSELHLVSCVSVCPFCSLLCLDFFPI